MVNWTFGAPRSTNGIAEKKFYLGIEPRTGRRAGIEDKQNLPVCAKNASGKGTGIIVPNLVPDGYPGSIFCTDPNLENANITAGPCADAGFDTLVMDAYLKAQGRASQCRCKWNILDELDL